MKPFGKDLNNFNGLDEFTDGFADGFTDGFADEFTDGFMNLCQRGEAE